MPEDPHEEYLKLEARRKETALNVLREFVSDYGPAKNEAEAEVFFSTAEIQNSIKDHTGTFLETPDIFECLSNMGYIYKAKNGLDFKWLMVKED